MASSSELHSELMNQMIHQLEDFALFLIDKNGIIISWNDGAENVTGYTRDDVLGRNASALIGDFSANQETIEGSINEAIQKEVAHHVGWRVHKTKGLFWADIKITPLKHDDGSILGYSILAKDITEGKNQATKNEELIQKLHAKNKELEEFTYMISHDLQEPLRTIRSFIGILDSKYKDQLNEKVVTITSTISRASERMNGLLLDLLDHSRIGRNKEKPLINLNDLCENVRSDLNSLITRSQASISCPSPLPDVEANQSDMQMLFQNLVSNAIKFTKPENHPEIEILFEDKKEHYQFCVSDKGIGIAENQQERIFIIFQRLHGREEIEGSGIGLAHCKKIVELHNGKIWVESVPNEGSQFYFTLPKSATSE
ncbi:MAG: ATP-binding protein [Crocinitomicaceae bacterium]